MWNRSVEVTHASDEGISLGKLLREQEKLSAQNAKRLLVRLESEPVHIVFTSFATDASDDSLVVGRQDQCGLVLSSEWSLEWATVETAMTGGQGHPFLVRSTGSLVERTGDSTIGCSFALHRDWVTLVRESAACHGDAGNQFLGQSFAAGSSPQKECHLKYKVYS